MSLNAQWFYQSVFDKCKSVDGFDSDMIQEYWLIDRYKNGYTVDQTVDVIKQQFETMSKE